MSKALSYKEAQTIRQACICAGLPTPSLKYIMQKRKPWMWDDVIMAAEDFMDKVEDFKRTMSHELDSHAT